MDLSPCTRPHLFFRVLFTDLSDSWAEWPTRNPSSIRISGGGCTRIGASAFLVRAYVAMVFKRLAHADGAVLGRYRGFTAGSCERVAASHAGGLLCLFSFLH